MSGDWTGLGKIGEKIIEACGSTLGWVMEPRQIRRIGRAEVDVSIMKEHAQVEMAAIRKEGELKTAEIAKRADYRMRYRELQRQANLESVIARGLAHAPDVGATEPVDPDWLAKFFDECQDVSNETMQNVWGKMLAGEMAKPGSYSMRTLALVPVLTQRDAKLFTEYGRHLVVLPVFGYCDPSFDGFESFLHKAGLGDREFLHLDAIGLVNFATLGRESDTYSSGLEVSYYDSILRIRADGDHVPWDYRTRTLTDVGRELAEIARDGTTPVPGLFDALVEHWRTRYGCWVDVSDRGST